MSHNQPTVPKATIEKMQKLLRVLEPGDRFELKTNERNDRIKNYKQYVVDRIEHTSEYYRVYVTGPSGGKAVIYVDDTPPRRKAYPAPEICYTKKEIETTNGTIIGLRFEN